MRAGNRSLLALDGKPPVQGTGTGLWSAPAWEQVGPALPSEVRESRNGIYAHMVSRGLSLLGEPSVAVEADGDGWGGTVASTNKCVAFSFPKHMLYSLHIC